MRLFIAEKPSIASCIAQELGIIKRCQGYIECKNNVRVTNCYGHMMELAGPDYYLPDSVPLGKNKRKVWREQDLPILPLKWQKLIKKDCAAQMKVIKEQLKNADEVVNAGDPDREGQLLIDEVLEYFAYKGKVLRYWQSAMDRVSVQRALQALVPNEKFYSWGVAAEARSRADWLIGMNMTRLATLVRRSAGVLSIGRVQTPVLRLIADRDLAIENFKPQTFYNLIAEFSCDSGAAYKGKWLVPEILCTADGYLLQRAAAEETAKNIIGQKAVVTAYEQTLKHQSPDLPFTLTDLQVACSAAFDFAAQKTLNIAQQLYEEFKLTSYPRSSCSYLPESQKADVPTILANLKLAFPDVADIIDKADPNRQSKIWNDAKVGEEAHTGIIPTLHAVSAEECKKLPDECRKVYELIAKRYIANFLPDYSYYQITAETQCESGDKFKTTAKNVINRGWKVFSMKKEDEEKEELRLPPLQKGKEVTVTNTDIQTGTTKPPAAFTEGSIIQAMENIAKYVDDPEEKKLLKEGDGIGTAATRAGIIDKLKERKFIEVKKKKLVSTELGRSFLQIVPPHLQSPSLTAQAERELKKIQAGSESIDNFIQAQTTALHASMQELKTVNSQHASAAEKCPACGAVIIRYASKFKKGEFYWHCSNQQCGKNYRDANGKPGAEIIKNTRTQQTCPCCGKKAARYPSKKAPGTYFWWCPDCKSSFTDNDGELGSKIEFTNERKSVTCPNCGKTAYRYANKTDQHKFHWFCPSCKQNFADNNGAIDKKLGK